MSSSNNSLDAFKLSDTEAFVIGAIFEHRLVLEMGDLSPRYWSSILSCAVFQAVRQATILNQDPTPWEIGREIGNRAPGLITYCISVHKKAPIDRSKEIVKKWIADRSKILFDADLKSLKSAYDSGKISRERFLASVSLLAEPKRGSSLVNGQRLIREYPLSDKERENQMMPIGMRLFDKHLGGLRRGGFVVLSAETGRAKSTFAIHIAMMAAGFHKNPRIKPRKVGLFSLEMGRLEVGATMAAAAGKLEKDELLGVMSMQEHTREGAERLATDGWLLNFHFADVPGLTPESLKTEIAMAAAQGVEIVIVDYLQLMNIPRGESRTLAIAEVTATLKALAEIYRISVIVLAQVNREAQKTGSLEIHNLAESSGIEKTGTEVIFLQNHRLQSDLDDRKVSREASESALDCLARDPIVFDAVMKKVRYGPRSNDTYYWTRHQARIEEVPEILLGHSIPSSAANRQSWGAENG